MKTKIHSLNLVRLLVVAVLVIPLALGAFTSARASFNANNMVVWGYNVYKQATIPSGLTDIVAISAGYFQNLALKGDGTVIGWGSNYFGQINIPSGLTGVIAISSGETHSLALKEDGTVVGWGDNSYGQATPPSGLTDVIAIAAGSRHSLALKSDGTVVGWGANTSGQATPPSGLTNIVAIAAGLYHNLALKSDGTLVGWGADNYGQATPPSGLTDVVAISGGFLHSLALKSDGTVVAWGWNDYHQTDVPSDLIDVVAIAAGAHHSLALKNDGTVVGWGANTYGQVTPPSGLTGVVAIAAGGFHNIAIVPADVPSNTAPTANPGGPYLSAVNTAISFDGSLSSDPENDTVTYAWDFGDGALDTGVAPTHSYTAAGVYNVCLTVSDGSLSSSPTCTLAVVYDPSAGFVTGGGWIDSPAGAYKPDETLAGQATFGFVAKYKKGETIPSGTTAFQFDLAGLAFSSTSYEWLVVNQGGTNAQFKGSGLINGLPDSNGNAYKFQLWATDGSTDTFRIRIWSEDADGIETVVYDNGVAQGIGGGNIVVHTSK